MFEVILRAPNLDTLNRVVGRLDLYRDNIQATGLNTLDIALIRNTSMLELRL